MHIPDANTVLMMSANPVSYIPQSACLLDQLRAVLRYKHYSLRTEEACLYWVKFFVRWHGCGGQVRHPCDMGAAEVQQLLSMLTTECNVSVSTHNQALGALLFLYREVLGVRLPWLADVQRPTRPRRIPSVLTVAEVAVGGTGSPPDALRRLVQWVTASAAQPTLRLTLVQCFTLPASLRVKTSSYNRFFAASAPSPGALRIHQMQQVIVISY